MHDIQPFTFPTTVQQVRVVLVDGEPWFVAADVARILGYRDAATATRTVRESQKGTHQMCTPGGDQTVSIISEPGLYRLIMRSNVTGAEAFQDWVTGEVLPAIRRTGHYEPTPMDELELAERYVESIKARRVLEARTAELEAATAEMAPKADAFDAFMEADGTYSMGAVANLLGIGRTSLFRQLRDLGVLQRDNRPYQRYAKHFKVVAGSHDRNGSEVPHFTTYVHPTGVDFVRRKLFPPGSQLTLVAN